MCTHWQYNSPPSLLRCNGADGISDTEGKAAVDSGERVGTRASCNGADGISDIEGKAAVGSGERVGTRASFNFA